MVRFEITWHEWSAYHDNVSRTRPSRYLQGQGQIWRSRVIIKICSILSGARVRLQRQLLFLFCVILVSLLRKVRAKTFWMYIYKFMTFLSQSLCFYLNTKFCAFICQEFAMQMFFMPQAFTDAGGIHVLVIGPSVRSSFHLSRFWSLNLTCF